MATGTNNFHGIDMIPSFLRTTTDGLGSSQEQLRNMKLIKNMPHILDDEIIHRSLKLYNEQNEHINFYLEQCNHWKKYQLTELEKQQVFEIESSIIKHKVTNKKILSLLDYCQNITIDKILAKDDMELALEVLTGNTPFPKRLVRSI
jgi:hypothetical protein